MSQRLAYEPVDAGEYDEFLHLLREEATDYLDRTMALMRVSWEDFGRIVRSVGHVRRMRQAGVVVGFYWVEERGRIVHLHGLAVKREFQGRGIGTETIRALIEEHGGVADAIELGVHDSNRVARALYEKLGFNTVKRLDDLGFSIMQRPLSGTDSQRGKR